MAAKKRIIFKKADPKQLKRINAIARVSSELFATKGYLKTSMDDLSAAANVTKGGIYHYFASKNDILYFICSTYVELDLDNLEQCLISIQTTNEKIKFIIFRHIEHYTTHVFSAKTLLHEASNLPPHYFKKVKALERRYYEIVAQVMSNLPTAKGRKDVGTALAFTLFGMLNWIYSWYNPRGGIKPKDMSQLIYEIFTNGVNGPILRDRED